MWIVFACWCSGSRRHSNGMQVHLLGGWGLSLHHWARPGYLWQWQLQALQWKLSCWPSQGQKMLIGLWIWNILCSLSLSFSFLPSLHEFVCAIGHQPWKHVDTHAHTHTLTDCLVCLCWAQFSQNNFELNNDRACHCTVMIYLTNLHSQAHEVRPSWWWQIVEHSPLHSRYLVLCHFMLQEHNSGYRGWLQHSTSDGVEGVDISYKKVGDGHPLSLWRGVTEVAASPTAVLNRILHERSVRLSTFLSLCFKVW